MRTYLSFLAALTLAIVSAETGTRSSVAAFQSGTFEINTQYVTGLASPTAMDFTPDGRMFVTQQAGAIRVITAAGQLLSTPFWTITNLNSSGEQGVLGIAIDPDFNSNGYVYVFYTPSNPRNTRLSRVTANGNQMVANSEVILLEYGNFSGNHRGGELHFGTDGKLYVAIGDAGGPSNAQSVTSFDGKILRLNKDGTIPSDNPTTFTNTGGATLTPTGQYRAIWAIGLRNPFRFAVGPDGQMRINDVGGIVEEVNVGQRGANYGWPSCEGNCTNPAVTRALYMYNEEPACAITGGAFYSGNQFPGSYYNAYFFFDYCGPWMKYILPNNTVQSFPLSIPDGSVGLFNAPDGSLYVLGHGSGTISRIRYAGGGTNRTPVARATANPTSGAAPLNVSFSGSGSSDPDGDPLSYSWTFGDNASATGVSTSHSYAASGAYTARLTVSDGRGGTHFQDVPINVGTRPTATITVPAQGAMYSAGDTISFSGTATDAEDGTLAPSAFSWTVLFHHASHTHPEVGPINGTTSGSFVAPTVGHTEENVFYRIYLTVTDSTGLQTQVTRDVQPRKATITVTTNVAGAQILLDGQPHAAPYTFVGVVGVRQTIDVVSPQTVNGQSYQFLSWSDGGAKSHVIAIPSTNTTYTATLGAEAAAPRPPVNIRIIR